VAAGPETAPDGQPGDRPTPATMAAVSRGPGHLSRRLFQLHGRLWQQTVGDEVTGPQFTALGVLHVDGPMDQRSLGERARLDKSTTTPLLERLARRGLVEITRDAADRRRKLLQITPAGTRLLARVAPKAVEVGEQMLAPLDAGEREQLLALLERVC
jgi:DNA-binding MarR family transcriptional regulator